MNFPDQSWSQDPVRMGWNTEMLKEALEAIGEFGSLSTIVAQNGRLIATSGTITEKVLVRSIRKSFLSALIGIAVERRQIDLDMSLEQIDIDDVEPRLTPQERQATVRELLQARSGIYHAAIAESPEMTASKPPRGSALPGQQWHYNNWDFNALGTIYEQCTKQSLYVGFLEEIAQPIGMEDFTLADGVYAHGPESCHPAYHFKMTVRDMARFGHLYLNSGRWKAARIIPSQWVQDSTVASSHTQTALGGYGYMWWTTGHAGEAESARIAERNAQLPRFRCYAWGAFGQMICVVPEKQIVLATLCVSKPRPDPEWGNFWKFVRFAIRASPDTPARNEAGPSTFSDQPLSAG